MAAFEKIWERVYQVGGSNLSDPRDASVFLVEVGSGESVLIDCGAGRSFDELILNIESAGLNPKKLKALILTHCHIDHIGSAVVFKEQFGGEIIAHEFDADAIEGRDITKTAADWYGVDYKPVKIDRIMKGELEKISYGEVEFYLLHTPGHTPGSISVYCDIESKRILFGQDIHGPFDESFGSDIDKWRVSMKKLLKLEADILCEGHFGVYKWKDKVEKYINGYLGQY